MPFEFSQCKQKGFAPIYLLIGVVVLAAVAGAYYLGQNSRSTSQTSQVAPTLATTVDWKVYNNQLMGIAFKYPLGNNLQEYPGNDGKSISIGNPNSGNAFYISFFENNGKLDTKDWIKANFNVLYPNVVINEKKITYEDLKFVNKQLGNQKVLEVDFGGIGTDNFFPNPTNTRIYLLKTGMSEDLFDQIFSTFKFN